MGDQQVPKSQPLRGFSTPRKSPSPRTTSLGLALPQQDCGVLNPRPRSYRPPSHTQQNCQPSTHRGFPPPQVPQQRQSVLECQVR
ncbi:hypothetical protein K443DRAFT_354943 [Laccaria amethystina LaAM-08-1]|uniref:Uncharacterized protein n=1 Tax=Laccaria amethystina LaAM-08-1 TaxID=1095629 RepID=A0A0C9XEN4_9AGAR|nr:hypothetical protein K443DRAFT_354943 [Laccaria amethystina LaAM-08-1]